jgi:hypothetical protein
MKLEINGAVRDVEATAAPPRAETSPPVPPVRRRHRRIASRVSSRSRRLHRRPGGRLRDRARALHADLAIAVLAAGGSRRLGRPKQLVELHGAPLVHAVAATCVAANAGPVAVVLGAQAAPVAHALGDLRVAHGRRHAVAHLAIVTVVISVRPRMSGKYIASIVAGITLNVPSIVARAW